MNRTTVQSQETRKALLKAAEHLFMHHGVSSTSLDSISKLAGVTRGALYFHFENKYSLVNVLYQDLYQSLLGAIISDLEWENPAPLKHLRALCIKLLIDIETYTDKLKILKIFYLRCDYSGELAPLLKMQTVAEAKSRSLMQQYFQRAKEAGHLAEYEDVDVLTTALQCFLSGICQDFLRYPNNIIMCRDASNLVDVFFNRFKNTRNLDGLGN